MLATSPVLAPTRRMSRQLSERAAVFVIGAVQFVNILDFMIVMPLGPDFSGELHIPVSRLGLIGGSYTAAAAVAGLAGSFFLDRYDRRVALGVALVGLVCGTAAGGLATGLGTLVLARIVAGAFGGPATSVALSVIADVIPAERRGKAMGAVMGAFAAASVLGVPLGLELSRLSTWRLPFFVVAGFGAAVAIAMRGLLPSMRGHLARRAGAPDPTLRELFLDPLVVRSYAMTATAMMAGFILIPNLSAFTQYNLHYPREHLGLLYLAGGLTSFGTMRVVGGLVDRFGSTRVATIATLLLASVIFIGFTHDSTPVPVLALFIAFMVAMSSRNVAYNTLTSKVPSPVARARFMSIQSAVQHLASAIGAILAAQLLTERADKGLEGMPLVAAISIGLCLTVPLLMAGVEGRVRRRDVAARRPAGPAAPAVATGADLQAP